MIESFVSVLYFYESELKIEIFSDSYLAPIFTVFICQAVFIHFR